MHFWVVDGELVNRPDDNEPISRPDLMITNRFWIVIKVHGLLTVTTGWGWVSRWFTIRIGPRPYPSTWRHVQDLTMGHIIVFFPLAGNMEKIFFPGQDLTFRGGYKLKLVSVYIMELNWGL